jgi:hypothetical protein
MDVMMGDLVLTEEEVNPVMSRCSKTGWTSRRLHNHFFWEQPRVSTCTCTAWAPPPISPDVAKPAVESHRSRRCPRHEHDVRAGRRWRRRPSMARRCRRSSRARRTERTRLQDHHRPAGHRLREHGAVINARMGLNTWAAFAGTNDDAMVAGDVAMLPAK